MVKINNKEIYNYTGAIHIHSKCSDGTGNIYEISKAAKKTGLDFIIITDHNNMDIEEGFFNGVCVIKAEEISPYYKNHYLAFGTNRCIDFEQSPKDFTEEVRTLGGFGFCAHPDESQSRKNSHKPIRWQDKNITPDGVEIWNWFSSWADKYCDKNILSIAYAYLFHHSLVTTPTQETIKWWDELNEKTENIVPAIGGIDAHALKINKYIIPVTIFPYEDMFNTISNVINLNEKLSEDFIVAKKQILEAIRQGQNIVINRKICKNIPKLYISNSSHRAYCGGSVNFDNNCCINISLCDVFDIRLICNGIVIYETRAKSFSLPITQKGKYRVEIVKNKKGYAYTNPILVTS